MDIIWSLQGLKETLLIGGNITLSRCSFNCSLISSSQLVLQLEWRGAELVASLQNCERFSNIFLNQNSAVWDMYLISASGETKSVCHTNIYKSTEEKSLVPKQFFLENNNDYMSDNTLRLLSRFTYGTSSYHKILYVTSNCGTPCLFTYTIPRFSMIKDKTNIMFNIDFIDSNSFPNQFSFFMQGKYILFTFTRIPGPMMLKKVIIVLSNGDENVCWRGNQFLSKDFSEFIRLPLVDILKAKNSSLPKDELTLRFEFTDYTNISSCYINRIVVGKIQTDLVSLVRSFSESVFGKGTCEAKSVGRSWLGNRSIRTDLGSLQRKGTFSDFSLKAGSESFPVHRALLCARSPVFEAMLAAPMRESGQGAVDIPDFRPDTVRRLVRFLYTDSVPDLGPDSALELYSAADKYAVLALRNRCSEVLASGLSSPSVLSALSLSERHDDPGLKDKCVEFIGAHQGEVFGSTQWAAFMKEDSSLAVQVLHALNVKKLKL